MMKTNNAKSERPPTVKFCPTTEYTKNQHENSVTNSNSKHDKILPEDALTKTVSNPTRSIDKNQIELLSTRKDIVSIERISDIGNSLSDNKIHTQNTFSSSPGIKLNYDHMTSSFFIPKSYYSTNPNFKFAEGAKIPRSFKLEEMNTNPNSNSSGSGSYSSAHNSKNSSSNKLLTVLNDESQASAKITSHLPDTQGGKIVLDPQEGSTKNPYLRQDYKFTNLDLLQAKSSPDFDKLACRPIHRFHMSPHENFSRNSQPRNEYPFVTQTKNDFRYTRKYSHATDTNTSSKFRPPTGKYYTEATFVKNPFISKKSYPYDSEDERNLGVNQSFNNKIHVKKQKHLIYGVDNYEILTLDIKLAKESKQIKLRRYDDLHETVANFVKENQIKTEMIKPILHHILKSLNGIYSVLNSKIEDVDYLASLMKLWEKTKEKADEERMQRNKQLSTRSCDELCKFDSSSDD